MGASVPSGGGKKGRRGRRKRGSPPMAEINVTPFVDVMLVLLIIFMVSTPLLSEGVPIELPKTAAQPLPTDKATLVVVSVDAENQIYLGEDPVDMNSLISRLEEEMSERVEDRIHIKADGELAYTHVLSVMAALREAGFANFGLVSAKKE